MDSPSEGQEEETKEKEMIYDHIDMRNSYRMGFWIGTVSGGVSVFVVLLLVGLFIS